MKSKGFYREKKIANWVMRQATEWENKSLPPYIRQRISRIHKELKKIEIKKKSDSQASKWANEWTKFFFFLIEK